MVHDPDQPSLDLDESQSLDVPQRWVKIYLPLPGQFASVLEQAVFHHLVLQANWRAGPVSYRGRKFFLKRGQVVVTVGDLAAAFRCSYKEMRTILAHLWKLERLQMGKAKGKAATLLTICNYDKYQAHKIARGEAKGEPRAKVGRTDQDSISSIEGKKEREAPPKHTNGVETTLPARADITARGARLGSDWVLPKEWADWAWSQGHQMPELEGDKFRDYWIAKPGAAGRKVDWFATWRNWIRRSLDDDRQRPTRKETADEARERRRAPAAAAVARRLGAGLPGGSAED